MHMETRRRDRRATVVLTGTSDDAAGIPLFAELAALLEDGVTTVVIDVRHAVNIHPSIAATAARFHELFARLGGGLTIDPPADRWFHQTVPSPRRPDLPKPDRAGASRWFG